MSKCQCNHSCSNFQIGKFYFYLLFSFFIIFRFVWSNNVATLSTTNSFLGCLTEFNCFQIKIIKIDTTANLCYNFFQFRYTISQMVRNKIVFYNSIIDFVKNILFCPPLCSFCLSFIILAENINGIKHSLNGFTINVLLLFLFVQINVHNVEQWANELQRLEIEPVHVRNLVNIIPVNGRKTIVFLKSRGITRFIHHHNSIYDFRNRK